jgi:hypothetical protein
MGKFSALPNAPKQLRRTWDKLCARLDRGSLAIMRTLHIEKQTLVIGVIVLVLLVLMVSCGGSSDSARPKKISRAEPKDQGEPLAGIQERLSKQRRLPSRQDQSTKRDYAPPADWQTTREPQRADPRNSARFGGDAPPPPAINQAETEQDRQRSQAQETIAWQRQQWEQAARSAGSTIQSSSSTGQSYTRKQPSYNTEQSYNTRQSYSSRQPSYGTGQSYRGQQPSYGDYNYATSDYNNRRSYQTGSRY